MICLSAASMLVSQAALADPDPLQDMDFFLFLAESETADAELTTPLDLETWQAENTDAGNEEEASQ